VDSFRNTYTVRARYDSAGWTSRARRCLLSQAASPAAPHEGAAFAQGECEDAIRAAVAGDALRLVRFSRAETTPTRRAG
jgi:hypothetical protein